MTTTRRLAVLALALALTACATRTGVSIAHGADSPGFLLGLWHGFIFPVAFILSIFVKGVAVYAVPNQGLGYDAGYFIGIVFLGVGANRTHVVYRDRVVVRR